MDDAAPAVRTLARLGRHLERACTDLSLAQYRVLALVASGDERAGRLAGRLAVARPTVTAVVDGLVERGLLRRCEEEGDRRATRICITPAGRRALHSAEQEMAQRLEAVLARAADRQGAVAALADLEQALDRLAAERMPAAGG